MTLMRTSVVRIALLVLLTLLAGCASTSVDFSGNLPTRRLCQAAPHTGVALVLWSATWRPDQKDVALREAAAEQGLKDYFFQSSCLARAEVRRTAAGTRLTPEQARQLALAVGPGVDRLVVIAVRELGPVVKVLSSAALVEGGTEVVLEVSTYEVSETVVQSDFMVHWKNGGPGVVKGVASLPQDMRDALTAAFEQVAAKK
jgi:hypothetical protein